MTDIVQRLHELKVWLLKNDLDMKMPAGMIDPEEAADEIDRLRAEVERLKSDRASAEPDWFWRDLDPDDSGDTVEEALRHMPQGVVCHIRSSYIGPSFFAATAPVLDADSDDQEYIRADTEEECRALVRARWKARAALTPF
jgi:hypothetical protein